MCGDISPEQREYLERLVNARVARVPQQDGRLHRRLFFDKYWQETPRGQLKLRRWDEAVDPMRDLHNALDDLAAHGYGGTAMMIGERLGVLKGEDEQ